MGLDVLIPKLRGVKFFAGDRFIARCPAHQDRSPSLAGRLKPDGRILMHCFAGCEPDAILSAIGLNFGDLFPAPLTKSFFPRVYKPFSDSEALQCLASESAVVAIAAANVAEGVVLTPTDQERVNLAAGRIASALEVAHA